jgi:hypothetical protein
MNKIRVNNRTLNNIEKRKIEKKKNLLIFLRTFVYN